MSAWVDGKLKLKCSIDIFVKILEKIRPQWKGHLLVDPSGKLTMYKYLGEVGDKKAAVVMPGSGRPGGKTPPGRDAHNDWGWYPDSEGVWHYRIANFGKAEGEELMSSINEANASLLEYAFIEKCKIRGYQVEKVTTEGGKTRIQIKVNDNRAEEILGVR